MQASTVPKGDHWAQASRLLANIFHGFPYPRASGSYKSYKRDLCARRRAHYRAGMHVTLLAAQSLDGFITQHDTPGSGFTSPADKTHFRSSLSAFDCSVMGGETYRVSRDLIRSRLTGNRLRVVLTRAPEAYAADATPSVVEFSDLSVSAIVQNLQDRGYKNCALLGGAQLHSLFLQAGLVNEIWLTIEPVLFGRGTPFLARSGEYPLRLLTTGALSADTLLLKYQVLRASA